MNLDVRFLIVLKLIFNLIFAVAVVSCITILSVWFGAGHVSHLLKGGLMFSFLIGVVSIPIMFDIDDNINRTNRR